MKSKTLFSLIVLTLFTSLIPAMHAQTFSVIYTFTGHTDGFGPITGVTIRGNALYGATVNDCGHVYQLTHSGSNWLFSKLAALCPYGNPESRPVFGPDGHLYGTAYSGGPGGSGAAFKLTPQVGPCKDAACYWTVNSLHDFRSGTDDGASPANGDLIWDQQGNIYGTTSQGGASQNCGSDYGCGTVYELSPSGNGYTESFLYSFSDTDGAFPYAGLVFDKNGNLFGAASSGGLNGQGVIFELSYVEGVWTENVLYTFQGASDGSTPFGGLIFDAAGNLYGTTYYGGSGGGGTVFELSPSGNTWIFKLLYSFSGPDGCGPGATLAMDGAGNLYGTTACDFADRNGNVFELANTENGWVYTSLHDFTGGSDGMAPTGIVSIGTDGALYGVAAQGGTFGQGVVWMLKP